MSYITYIAVIGFLLSSGCSSRDRGDYSYNEIEVEYLSSVDNIMLAGTLTMPQSNKPVPGVILIQGSGPHERDQQIGKHRIFRDITHHLSKKGFAVLRTDKRGCGHSEGKYVFGDIENFTEDGFSGIEFLSNYPGIDSDNIGIIGHSLGGLIAAKMATQSDKIHFIVSMASSGYWGRDALFEQNMQWAKLSGVSQKEFGHIRELCNRTYEIWMLDSVTAEGEQEYEMIYSALAQYLDEELRNIYYPEPAQKVLHYYRQPEFQKAFQMDISKIWAGVQCDVLLLKGSLDHNVSDRSSDMIEEYLRSGGNSRYQSIILKNHNHHFQHCKTGRPSEVQEIDEAISSRALSSLTEWIISVTND